MRLPRSCLWLIVALCLLAQLWMWQNDGSTPPPPSVSSAPPVTAAVAAAPLPVDVAASPPPPPPPPPRAASTAAASTATAAPTLADADCAPGGLVHVLVGADRTHWPGVVGVINSVTRNCASPARLRLHLVVLLGEEGAFRRFLRCHGLEADGERLTIHGFDKARLPALKVQAHLTNLESPLNFARFYMGELLGPGVCKVLYLDADVVVQGDAAELADLALPRGALCAATLRKNTLGVKGVQGLKGEKLQARFESRYGRPLPLEEHGFNAGVFVYNLRRWAALNLTEEAEYWIQANTREKLYQLGSQPPLTLSVLGRHGRCQELPAAWHLDCLGCIGQGRIKTAAQLADAKLLHWNGPNKPFPTAKGKRAHAELFEPYAGKGAQCKPGGG